MSAIVVTEQINPMSMLQSAIDKGVTPEQLEKLVALQERWERNRAAEAFALAMAEFQSKCPVVGKSRTVKDRGGHDIYKYASYDNVMEAIRPQLADTGLAITFTTQASAGALTITCRVRKGIHAEDTTLTIPTPTITLANASQIMGAALSYAKRYALCAALNIVCSDEDNDGNGLHEAVSAEQVEEMNELIAWLREKGKWPEERTGLLLKHCGVAAACYMSVQKWKDVCAMLRSEIKKVGAKP